MMSKIRARLSLTQNWKRKPAASSVALLCGLVPLFRGQTGGLVHLIRGSGGDDLAVFRAVPGVLGAAVLLGLHQVVLSFLSTAVVT